MVVREYQKVRLSGVKQAISGVYGYYSEVHPIICDSKHCETRNNEPNIESVRIEAELKRLSGLGTGANQTLAWQRLISGR